MHYTKADGLSSNHVSWITTQGNDVWFASKEDGVSRFDKVTGEWTIYKQSDFLADNDVRDLTRDPDGNLWMATVAGISVYSPQTRSWEIISKEDGLPTPYVTSILITKAASVKESTQGRQQKSNHPEKLTDTRHLKIDNYSVWVGTDRGLGTRIYTGDKWTFHTPAKYSYQWSVKRGCC